MSQERKLSASSKFDPVIVATLASRLLPPMVLPEGWQKMQRSTLKYALSATERPPLPEQSDWTGVSKFEAESAFDVVACEAVKRARCLLEHATGIGSAEIEKRACEHNELRKKTAAPRPEEEQATAEFVSYRGEKEATLFEIARFALREVGRLKESTTLATLRAWKRAQIASRWRAGRFDPVPIVFSDEEVPDGCVRPIDINKPFGTDSKFLPHPGDPDSPDAPGCYILEKFAPQSQVIGGVGGVIIGVRNYYLEHREEIHKKISTESGGRGGRKPAKNAKAKNPK